VPEGTTVAVSYEGRFVNPDGSDGDLFDSSVVGGVDKPFIFKLGSG
jgi:FKBP-type peptidyl-prolyl cis-trans isomerase